MPGTPTLTLIAIVCGISTCLYRSQRPRLLPPVSLSARLSLALTPCCCLPAAVLYLRPIPAVSLHYPCQGKSFSSNMAAHRQRPLLFWHFAFCLWQRHNQKGQAAAPLQAQLSRYWQAITTETPLPRGDARLFILDSQLSLVFLFLFVAAAAAARCRPF